MRILRCCACLALILSWHAPALHGQASPPPVSHRPALRWQTVRTEHFDVHHPAELAAWAQAVAARVEAARAALVPHVGHAPGRTHLVVDEVGHVTGGFAWAVTFDLPLVLLWPGQQMPVLGLTQLRPDVLATHEIAHIAHLGRPSRSRWARVWPRLVPPSWDLSPILLGSPGWVVEGYATYTEGRITGAGTPFSVLRAALLRQWALDGRLPRYAELNGARGFLGSRVPYGVGSAYFEWLEERAGDEAIRRLWTRMAAADRPAFAAAFTEVFGARPDELYARFAADVTARATEARDSLAAAGLVEGETVRRLEQMTGAPAISPDGRYVAISLRGGGEPPRLAILELAASPPATDGAAGGRARTAGSDGSAPTRQPPQVAALRPVAGRPYEEPRFLPGGRGVVATRRDPMPDGTLRSDLFVWEWTRGAVRRVTHGAGIHTADPSPDGRVAVADRCLGGTCDLVLVDLESGGVRVLAAGGPFLAWSRPRWAPDGRAIVAARNQGGRWRVVLLDSAGAEPRAIDPDDGVSRYAPAFTPDGAAVVAVSERGGIHTLVRLDPATRRETSLTRVTGAAVAPAPHPDGDLYFLRLHTGGLDLARLRREEIRPLEFVSLPSRLAPVVPPSRGAADTLAVAAVDAPRPYGAGPRRFGFLPAGAYTAEGRSFGLAVTNTDPVGRLTVLLQGALASGGGGWEGAALGATWRGSRPAVTAELFAARQAAGARPGPAPRTTLRGGAVSLALDHAGQPIGHRVRAGGSLAALDGAENASGRRLLGFVEGRVSLAAPGTPRMEAELSGHLGAGMTRDSAWRRAVGVLDARLGGAARGLDARLTYGTVGAGAPADERFTAGGAEPSLLDPAVLSQHVALPFLPAATLGGRRFAAYRLALTGWPLEPFVWSGSAGEALDRWQHVVGVERTLAAPHAPYLRLPGGVQGRMGLGYSVNAPVPDRLRGWVTLSLRP
jgi:hypothetical protein